MFERFRSVARAVTSRNKVIGALRPHSPPQLGLVLNDSSGGRGAMSSSSATTAEPVSMEYLTKLQNDYSNLLNKLDRATDRLAPSGNQRNTLWASLGVEDYFRLIFRAYDAYRLLIPYWDQTLLINLEWYWNHRTVRTKTLNRIVGKPNLRNYAKELKGQRASVFLALLQEELDDNFEESNRPGLLTLLLELSDNSDELASTLWLTSVKRRAKRAYGGEAEVWVGSHDGQEVAVRDFWFPHEISPQRLRKIIRREILTNRQLNHSNVLRLKGVFQEEGHPMAVVSPWMANGTAMDYLEYHPVELLHILQGAAAGIHYLHSLNPPIIHGDIHPRNILVNADGDAVIRDLGASRVRLELATTSSDESDDSGPGDTKPTAEAAAPAKLPPKNPLAALFDPMTAHYHPPELHPPHLSSPSTSPAMTHKVLPQVDAIEAAASTAVNSGRPSTSSATTLKHPNEPVLTFSTDCYSLAMTFYELITSLRPFYHLIPDATALGNSRRRSHSPSRSRQTLHQVQQGAQTGSLPQSFADPKTTGMAILAAIQSGIRPPRPVTRTSPISAGTNRTTATSTTVTTTSTSPFYPPPSVGDSLPSINRTTSAPPFASIGHTTAPVQPASTPAPPVRKMTTIPIRGNMYDDHFQTLWDLLERMWAPDASARPMAVEVCGTLGTLQNRPPCKACFDVHRGKECYRESDDGDCISCKSIAIECAMLTDSEMDLGRGYGLNIPSRMRNPDGIYITELELPPSPDGLTPLQLVEPPRRARLVPFIWTSRRRQPSSTQR